MKPRHLVALLLAQTLLSAAEPAVLKDPPRIVAPNQAPRAWLGLQVSKPDASVTAHVPSLPPGVGFVVKMVDEGGPAQAAGLQTFDLVWKFNDQMLINEAQLATLLRLSKPGEEVVMSGFRGGKPLELKLKLGEAPAVTRPLGGDIAEAAVLPGSAARRGWSMFLRRSPASRKTNLPLTRSRRPSIARGTSIRSGSWERTRS